MVQRSGVSSVLFQSVASTMGSGGFGLLEWTMVWRRLEERGTSARMRCRVALGLSQLEETGRTSHEQCVPLSD